MIKLLTIIFIIPHYKFKYFLLNKYPLLIMNLYNYFSGIKIKNYYYHIINYSLFFLSNLINFFNNYFLIFNYIYN